MIRCLDDAVVTIGVALGARRCDRMMYGVLVAAMIATVAGCREPASPHAAEPQRCQPRRGPPAPASVWLLDVPDPAVRASLLSNTDRGIALAYYDGCRFEIPQCRGLGDYAFQELSMQDHHRIESELQLAAEIPLWWIQLGGALRQSGALDIDYHWKGNWRAQQGTVAVGGGPDCGRATHFISELHVGDFRVTTQQSRQAHGGVAAPGWQGGGQAASSNRSLHEGRDAPLRAMLRPITAASAVHCPPNTQWDGSACAPTVACPDGQAYDASVQRCVAMGAPRAFKITVVRVQGNACAPVGGCNYRLQAFVRGNATPVGSHRAASGQTDVSMNWLIDHRFSADEIDRGVDLTLHHDALLLGGSMSTCTITLTHRELEALASGAGTSGDRSQRCWDGRTLTFRIEQW